MKMQQIQYIENGHSEAAENLVSSSPVKEDEKLHLELLSRKNLTAMDLVGLSWILFEEDY